MDEVLYKSASELSRLIHARSLSPVELVQACLRKIEEVNPSINAFVSLQSERALEEAKAIADRLAHGEDPGPFAGIPIGAKDLEDVKGMPTTYGSVPFRDNIAQQDSIQVARLKRAGAILLGKTNTPEFGFTGFTKNRLGFCSSRGIRHGSIGHGIRCRWVNSHPCMLLGVFRHQAHLWQDTPWSF
ncbi:MAG: amidase [Deltaproteobacteria bacterium]|nr:amidase [Deltaproteobacteria bacterium]